MSRTRLTVGWHRPGLRFWLVLGLALVVVAILVVARLTGGDDSGRAAQDGPVATASPTGDGASSRGVAPSPTLGDDSVVGAPTDAARPPAAALTAATEFVRAWSAHPPQSAQQAWWRQVSQYTDPTLSAQLRAVNPDDVPSTRITGPATGALVSPTSAEIQVPTDAGRAVLLCVLVDARWLVATVDLEQAPS